MLSLLAAATFVTAYSGWTSCGPASPVAPLCEGMNFRRFDDESAQALRRLDEAGDGFDAGDIELLRLRQQARERADSLQRILRYDLDGDFTIDRREMERAVPSDFRTNSGGRTSDADRRQRELFFTYDADRDDRIEREEILSAPLPQANLRQLEELRRMLARDPNGDGRLEPAELSLLAREAFRAVDGNGDDNITPAEIEAERARAEGARTDVPGGETAQGLCALPPVPREARLVVFNAYEGAGATPGVTEVRVAPGPEPIYVVLASFRPIRWQFTGDVGRIAQVVLTSEPRNGMSEAEGVPAARVVTFREDCLGTSYRGGRSVTASRVWRSAGRRPDAVAHAYRAEVVDLPSPASEPARAPPGPSEIARDICADGGRAPIPTAFGRHGVQAQYSFVTQGARDEDLRAFLTLVSETGFSFLPITINLNGVDTLIVPGRAALTDAGQVEREFRAACALRTGRIYLGHVRHNLTTEQTRDQVRVR